MADYHRPQVSKETLDDLNSEVKTELGISPEGIPFEKRVQALVNSNRNRRMAGSR